jgi:hypothetical protein
MDAIAKYENAKGGLVKKMPILRDVCVLCAFTCLPPDRVRRRSSRRTRTPSDGRRPHEPPLLHPRSESSVCYASNTPSGGLPTRTTTRKGPGRGTSTSRPVRLATRHRVSTGTGAVATVSQLTPSRLTHTPHIA